MKATQNGNYVHKYISFLVNQISLFKKHKQINVCICLFGEVCNTYKSKMTKIAQKPGEKKWKYIGLNSYTSCEVV